MGQYWIPVNLDKREFIHPHKLGNGLKLWEQFASHPGTGAALIALCAAMPEPRGGGDLKASEVNGEKVIGRWAGDRIALVGDYAERSDLPARDNADLIYSLCQNPEEIAESVDWMKQNGRAPEAKRLEKLEPFRDISELVCQVIERELNGKFVGEGWRDFKSHEELAKTKTAMKPDFILTSS